MRNTRLGENDGKEKKKKLERDDKTRFSFPFFSGKEMGNGGTGVYHHRNSFCCFR